MAIPYTAIDQLVSGIPGEQAFDGPVRALSALLDTTTETNNVFGRAFTYKDEAVESVQAGGTGLFAGLMINPKIYLLDVEYAYNGTQAEFGFMGEWYVQLSTTGGTIGDPIYFVNATGVLGHGTATEGQTQIAGAVISRHNVSKETPTLAVVRLTQ